ncbi:hypothetical protein B566_EDAN002114 [Ephemera danica]|nr:hypothetical protein B566_EDAN002114 [Ephemera danica]
MQMNQNETNMDRWRDETPAQKELCQQCQLQGHWSQFCHSYPQVECSCRNKNSGRGMMENSFVVHPGQNSFSEFQECSSTQSFQRDPLSSLSHRTSPHLATLAAIAPTDSMGPPSVTHLKHKQAQDLFKQEDDIAKSLAHRRLGPPPQRHEPHSSQSHLERSPQRRASPSHSEMLRRRQIDLRMKTDRQRCKAESQSDHRSSASTSRPKRRVMETAHEVLRRRQKEIDYGKNTEGYRCYLAAVPKHKRSHRDIRTPPREIKYGRRAWDGMVRAWRRQLHKWDPPGHDDSLDNLDCNSGEGWCVLSSLDDTNNTTETSACPSDTGSEISYSGSGGNLRAAQSPSSTLSLDDFPHLV